MFFTSLIALVASVGVVMFLIALTTLVLRQKSSLIFDKYPRKGIFYYLKYRLALLVLKYLRKKFYQENQCGTSTQTFVESIDKPQPLSDDPQSYDVVSFIGASEKGQKLQIMLERRRRGVLKACLYLWLPEEGLLCLPNLPDMVYFTTDGDNENTEFRGSGFHIKPEKAMHRWRISFVGDLKRVNDNTLVSVKLDLTFTATTKDYFNYNRDLSAAVIADSVAREAWDDAFYKLLKNVDLILQKRMHYEQNGTLQGEVQIGDESKLEIQMRGFRDHSFGTERCLSTINRYVHFALFLEDGTNMVVGNLSQPSFFLSSLKVGYVCTPEGAYKPITSCNFELYSYGERGTPPKHKNFIVTTVEKSYFVQIKVEDSAVRYFGGGWESKVYNQFVACTVNGVNGQGLTEYLYRNKGGRPESVSCKDPEWYQRMRSYERGLSTGEPAGDDDDVFDF